MRWDERSSTTLHRLLLFVSSAHSYRHKHQVGGEKIWFLSFSQVPLLSLFCFWTHLAPKNAATFTLTFPHSRSHISPHALFFTCPLSIRFISLHKVWRTLSSPSGFPKGGDTVWYCHVCTGGVEIVSDAIQLSHPADKADEMTGPCGYSQPPLTCYRLGSTY